MISNRTMLTIVLGLVSISSTLGSNCQGANSKYCFNGPDSKDNYHVFDDAMSWCRNESSQLLAISDSETQDAVTQFLDSWLIDSIDLVYINMAIRSPSKGTWFLVNGSQYYGGVILQKTCQYKMYATLQMDRNLEMWRVFASKPTERQQYICEFSESACSKTNNNDFVHNGRCYVRHENEYVDWFEARRRCVAAGGDLATFNYPANESYYQHYEPPFDNSTLETSSSYYVGLRWDNAGWFSPSDGYSEQLYYNWSYGKPTTFGYWCVCLDPNAVPRWSWTDCDCDVPRQFLCRNGTTTPTPSGTTTQKSPQQTTENNSNSNQTTALIVGLVLGIGVILPLLIIIIVLIVIIIRQRKSEKPAVQNNNDGAYDADVSQQQHYERLQDTKRRTILLNQTQNNVYEAPTADS